MSHHSWLLPILSQPKGLVHKDLLKKCLSNEFMNEVGGTQASALQALFSEEWLKSLPVPLARSPPGSSLPA
jgi:hypothetical protein